MVDIAETKRIAGSRLCLSLRTVLGPHSHTMYLSALFKGKWTLPERASNTHLYCCYSYYRFDLLGFFLFLFSPSYCSVHSHSFWPRIEFVYYVHNMVWICIAPMDTITSSGARDIHLSTVTQHFEKEKQKTKQTEPRNSSRLSMEIFIYEAYMKCHIDNGTFSFWRERVCECHHMRFDCVRK